MAAHHTMYRKQSDRRHLQAPPPHASRAHAVHAKKLIDSAIEVLKRKRYAGFHTAEVAELAAVRPDASL